MKLIDADSFIADIEDENVNLYLDGFKGTPRPREISLTEVIDRIKEQDTVDAEPIRHGHWVNSVENDPRLYGWVSLDIIECSVCHAMSKDIRSAYCPQCGAKMDEEIDK